MSTTLEMPLRKAVVVIFVAMFWQDILATSMVVFESRRGIWIAGIFDALGYFAQLACSALAIDSIVKHGWRNKRSVCLLISVTISNYLSTATGVFVAFWLIRHGA